LSGPAVAAAIMAATGDSKLGELAAPLASVGVLVGASVAHFVRKWSGRPLGRPVQEQLNYDDPPADR